MAKYTLHYEDGTFLHESSRSFEKMKKLCMDKLPQKVKVCEEYLAPSPFNSKILTKHAKDVFKNYNNEAY